MKRNSEDVERVYILAVHHIFLSLGYCGFAVLANFLGVGRSTVYNYFDCHRSVLFSHYVFENGLYLAWTPNTKNSLHVTKDGLLLVKDLTLYKENGVWKLGWLVCRS